MKIDIDTINKYKTEFDYLINGGVLAVKCFSEIAFPQFKRWLLVNKDELTSFTSEFGEVYIINDECVRYRKALAEGKIIEEYYDACGQTGWTTFTGTFSKYSKYRIKPDEPKFNVDDWIKVYYNSKSCDLYYNKKIEYIYEDYIQCTDGSNIYFESTKIELWIPDINEYYWDKENGCLCKCTNIIQNKPGIQTALYGDIVDLTKKKRRHKLNACCGLSSAEPFIGSLPSHIKDK